MRLDVGCGANPQGDVNVDLYPINITPDHIYSWTQHSILHLLNLLSGNVKIEKLPHPSSGLMQIRAVMRVDS